MRSQQNGSRTSQMVPYENIANFRFGPGLWVFRLGSDHSDVSMLAEFKEKPQKPKTNRKSAMLFTVLIGRL